MSAATGGRDASGTLRVIGSAAGPAAGQPDAKTYVSPLDRAKQGAAPSEAEWAKMGAGERLTVGVELDRRRQGG